MKRRLRSSLRFAGVGLALVLASPPSSAQFGGLEWTLTGNPDGAGSLTPTTMTVTSPNTPPCAGGETVTYYETVAPVDGTVSAFLHWVNHDLSPEFDGPVFVVNGAAGYIHCDTFACPDFSVPFSFHVAAGDAFGLGALAEDCDLGAGIATFTEFAFTPDASRLDLATVLLAPGPTTAPTTSLDRVGDADGDGVTDVVLGAATAENPSGQLAGEARVVSGADGGVLAIGHGATTGDQYGASVSAAGDVDGDGRADHAVGAATADGPALASTGTAEIRSGATGAVLHAFHGSATAEFFGASIDGGGDVDGDGVPDLVVGAWNATGGPALLGAGRVRVHSGADGSLLRDIGGQLAHAWLGYRVSFGGDIDGDGTVDLVAGAPRQSGTGSIPGAVHAYSGATGAPLWSAVGPVDDGRFGEAVGSAGDVDGDGRDDVVAGAPNASVGALAAAGDVRVLSGADASRLWSRTGGGAFHRLGSSVGPVEDRDGDGVADVLATEPGFPGAEPHPGVLHVLSGTDGADVLSYAGLAGVYGIEGAATAVDDLNGDGVGELVAVSGDGARILSGTCGASVPYGAGCPTSAGAIPELLVGGCAARGAETRIAIVGGPAGAPAVVLVSSSSANVPLGGGCTLLVGPPSLTLVTGPLLGVGAAGGGVEVKGIMPTAMTGPCSVQGFVLAPATALGFVATNGVAVEVP